VPLREDWLAAGAVSVLVLALGWWWAAAVTARTAPRRVPAWAAAVAVATTAVYVAPALAPLTAATWYAFGLAVPQGVLGTGSRRLAAAAGLVLGGAASGVLAGSDAGQPSWAHALGWALVAAGAGPAIAVRACRVDAEDRARLLLIGAAAGLATAFAGGVVALSLLVSVPRTPGPWAVGALVLLPTATAAGWFSLRARRSAPRLFIESVALGGTALLTGAVYLVVVVGLGRPPDAGERSVLGLSLVAAVVIAVLALPVRHRLLALGTALVGDQREGAERLLTGFGARMSRAIPMDELLLQLVESLHGSIAPGGAEVWVGDDGALGRTAAVPHRPAARVDLDPETLRVVAGARIGGRAWASVWLPWLGRSDTDDEAGGAAIDAGTADLRVVPLAHLGLLRGLLVVRGTVGSADFAEDSEALLVDLGRQLALALHNVGLDSALQASLTELEQRNAELQASRLRIVTASDESRRTIERNLHDGAQQHLVALAVKLGVAGELVDDDPAALRDLLSDLREDVSVTIGELRSLAHGIYPPLLRERGLAEALRAAALRSPLAARVTGTLPGRMAAEVEAAAYFCCLEAMQNSAKHAGDDATVEVVLSWCDGELGFEVRDDGVGFEPASADGHGFENMADRVGALSGTLQVVSTPGAGTSVRGRIPAVLLPVPSAPAVPSPTAPVAATGS
jgi:signal transduction histidine kinase